MKRNRKGFTLAELLIVVAIIAVLVAIAIPVFRDQLEKSREATDAANIRTAYAEVAALALAEPDAGTDVQVPLKQYVEGWQSSGLSDIAGVSIDKIEVKPRGTVEIVLNSGVIYIDGNEVKSSFIPDLGGGTYNPDGGSGSDDDDMEFDD